MYFKNSKNTASFIGHLGNDVKTTDLEGGNKVSKFELATTKVYGENKTEETVWIPCEIWGDHPVLEYLKKGKQVSVDAHYSNAKKGEGEEAKYYHSFKVENIILLGGAKSE